MNKKPLIIITGPTAVGKTSLSIALAKEINGEIISADSMQVYRHMDVGTAKIRQEEMCGIPHYLIDCLEPYEPFNVTVFQQLAKTAMDTIYSHNKTPILAGGTGFYIQALLYDISFTKEQGNSEIREELESLAKEKGPLFLHNMLSEIDCESADAIHANNVKRVIRAIEYYRLTGKKISLHNQCEAQKQSAYNSYYFVLTDKRELIYDKINKRVDDMITAGLVEEVKYLLAMGCTRDMVSMQGLGYKQITSYLAGEISLVEAIATIKRDTRHFAKRQLTWFRREKDVFWLNKADYAYKEEEILKIIRSTISL